MQWLPQDIWKYAVLLVLLFAIAAIAARSLIAYIDDQIGETPGGDPAIQSISWAIWALTVGFMFLAGALGVWAIRSESMKRIHRFVEEMGYLSDGLLVLDGKGRVNGANPAARRLAPSPFSSGARLREVFPCVTAEDLRLLLDLRSPREIEKNVLYAKRGVRTVRFRAEPSGGLSLVLLSDVTEMRRLKIRAQHSARQRLIGRIARGVAHDFDDILCGILGHTDLLGREPALPAQARGSLETIAKAARKGTALARQLLDLGKPEQGAALSTNLLESLANAARLLRHALAETTGLELAGLEDPAPPGPGETMEFPPVALAPAQIEQAVLSLGLLAADGLAMHGVLRISLSKPGTDHLAGVESRFAAVILISAHAAHSQGPEPRGTKPLQLQPTREDAGVIESVVRSILDEADGRLDVLQLPEGPCVYRLCLPHADAALDLTPSAAPAQDLDKHVDGWSVMIAATAAARHAIEQRLRETPAEVELAETTDAALARVQQDDELNALVIEDELLGPDSSGLLRAITKLRPHTGVVVLCAEPDERQDFEGVRHAAVGAVPDSILRALVEAVEAVSEDRPAQASQDARQG